MASQGETVDEAMANLREALDPFFESAGAEEVCHRLRSEVFVTRLEVSAG